MYSESTQIKIRTLIKAYLYLKGNATSKELADWINTHNFGLNKLRVSPRTIYSLIKEGHKSKNVLRDVQIRQVNDDVFEYSIKQDLKEEDVQ